MMLVLVILIAWPVLRLANAATVTLSPWALASAPPNALPKQDGKPQTFDDSGSVFALALNKGSYRVGQTVGEANSKARVFMAAQVNNAGGYSSGYLVSKISLEMSDPGFAVWRDQFPARGSATGRVEFGPSDGIFDPSTIQTKTMGGQPNRLRSDAANIYYETHTSLGVCCETHTRASFAAVWGPQPPGTPGNPPLPPVAFPTSQEDDDDTDYPTYPPPDSDDDLVQEPAEVSGSFLVNPSEFLAPITSDYGSDDPIYFTTQEPSTPGTGMAARLTAASHAPVNVLGYYFAAAAGSPYFRSFHLPELPPDQTYRLWTPDVFLEVTGSEVIDFTTLFPDGVSRFYVLGMGEHAPETFPHVFGLTFAEEGVADFFVAALAVPEPTPLTLAFVAAWFVLSYKRTR